MEKGTDKKMTPYWIRVKGSYKRFSDVPVTRINETILVKLGSNMDNIDAQAIVGEYINRVAGFHHNVDVYEVEVYEKEFTIPVRYIHVNNETEEFKYDVTPQEVSENMSQGIVEYRKAQKEWIANEIRMTELKGE